MDLEDARRRIRESPDATTLAVILLELVEVIAEMDLALTALIRQVNTLEGNLDPLQRFLRDAAKRDWR